MGQEFFGGPEYFQDFDPEKFARDLKAQAARDAREAGQDEHDEQDPHGESPQL